MNNNLKIYAKHYYSLGLNVTCITNYLTDYNFNKKNLTKTSYKNYESLQNARQTESELLSYDWENATGVGVVLGFNDLRAIDIDGCNEENIIYEILELLGLPRYYEWIVKSGSHNGYHILFYCKNNLQFSSDENQVVINYGNAKILALGSKKEYRNSFDRIEFLWGEHLALPPSLHKSTLLYEFLNNSIPETKPELIDFKRINSVIETFIDKKKEIYATSSGGIEGFSLTHVNSNNRKINLRKFKETDYSGNLFLIVDIETDGLPKDIEADYDDIDNWPNIIQIAWVVMDDEGRIVKKDSDSIIRENYNRINSLNINYNSINKIGDNLREVIKRFLNDAEEVNYIVAHNSDFDLKTIQAETLRSKFKDVINSVPNKICTMKLSVDFCKIENEYGYKYPTLIELYDILFDKEVIGIHNAEIDALMTAKCFWQLKTLNVIKL